MAEQNITTFTEKTVLDGTELLPILSDPSGTPTPNSVTTRTLVDKAFKAQSPARQTIATLVGDEVLTARKSDGTVAEFTSQKLVDLVSPVNGDQLYTLSGDETIRVSGTDGLTHIVAMKAITPHADHTKPRPFSGRVPVYPIRGVLDVMSDSSGYTTTVPAGGAVTNITADDAYGTKQWRMVTGNLGIGSFAVVRRNDNGRPINTTGLWVGVDLISSDPDKINDIQVYLGNTGLTAFYKWNNILGSQSVRPIQYGRKTRICFPVAVSNLGALGHASSVTGSPNLASINAWQVRIDDKGAGAAYVTIDRIFFFKPTIATSAVCMDDGYRSWWDLGKPIMDKYGIRSTIYAIRLYHDSSQSGFSQPSNRLTEAQLQTFVEQGHELGFHMTGNNAKEDFSPLEVHNEIKAFKKWAKNRFGFDVLSGAYPGGEQGYFVGPNYPVGHPQVGQPKPLWVSGDELKTVRDVFSDHFPFSRTIARVSPESYPAADNSLLKCFLYQYGEGVSYTTPAINQSYINTLVATGGVGVHSYHELVSGTPATGVTTQYNIADFEANMAYIASQINAGVMESLTLREAFGRGF
jgi:peptidoglycan/xylan/chitin deacetylase (PgdA/CDA1 family)